MRQVTVKGNRAIESQKILELNGFTIVSWTVIGRNVVFKIK